MKRSAPIPADAASRIAELVPQARLARRQHQKNDPKVLASQELTNLFLVLYDDGCTISALAKEAGLTYHSVSARIKNA